MRSAHRRTSTDSITSLMKQIEKRGAKVRRGCFPISEDAIFGCVTRESYLQERESSRTGKKGNTEKRKRKEKSTWRSALRASYLNIQRCVYHRSTSSRVKVTL